MTQVAKSLVQSSAAYFGQLAISLALVVVVSRILPPEQIGSYLMAYALIMLTIPLRDFQLQNYVIQREKITPYAMAPVTLVSIASSGVGLAICLAASAVFLAISPNAEIAQCLLIMSLTFLIRPISLLPMALLARDMRHGDIAAIRLAGALLKVAVTLVLLALGAGPEALAWGIVAEAMVELVALFRVPAGFRLVRPHAHGAGEVFRYCLPYTGAHLALTVSISATALLVGGYQGLAMAAFYNRGRMVMQLFRSGIEGAIQPVVLAQFSQVRDDLQLLKAHYLHATSLLTVFSWPALAWLIVAAEPTTLVLFGAEWRPTISLLQILSLGALVYSASALSQHLHAATGQTRPILIREVWLQLPYLAILLAVAPVSTTAVAGASVIAALIGFAVHQRLLNEAVGLRLKELAAATGKSALAALAVAAATFITREQLQGTVNDGALLAGLALVAALSWIAATAALRHPILVEASFLLRQKQAS